MFYRWVEFIKSKNLGPALVGFFEILNIANETREAKYRGSLPDSEARPPPYIKWWDLRRYRPGQVGYCVPPELQGILLEAGRLRWISISSAIFGWMFQLVKKKARRGDGEHYTSETNILKTLEPLFFG